MEKCCRWPFSLSCFSRLRELAWKLRTHKNSWMAISSKFSQVIQNDIEIVRCKFRFSRSQFWLTYQNHIIISERSPRLLTTRFGKRRLITTRFGKRDGGFVGSNLPNTEDNREKMAFGMDAWQARNSDRNMDYNASPYKLQNAKQNEFYNTIHRLEY